MEFMSVTIGADDNQQAQLQNLCRMCGFKADKAISIFGPEGKQHELAVKIQTHLPVKVSESDSLPLQLCFDCTSLLIQWDAALVGALAADRKLRALQWKQQQIALSKEKEVEVFQKINSVCKKQVTANAFNESLSCSICNRSGMDFRELIIHLKNHEPSTIRKNEKDCSISTKCTDALNETAAEKLEETPQMVSGSPKCGKSKKGKPFAGSPAAKITPEPAENVGDSVKSRLRKRKMKSLTAGCTDKDIGSEVGSGDPQVTSSTGTPPFKVDISPVSAVLQTLNSCSLNGKANELVKTLSTVPDPTQRAEEQLHDAISKPKVRIISAENINLSLEQRAKANMTVKPVESEPPQKVLSLAAGDASGKSLNSKSCNKNRIVLSSEVMKHLGNVRPGPKLLRLKDGRIVRLLDTAATVSPLSNSYQRIYRPLLPCSSKDAPPSSQGQPRSVLLTSAASFQPTISNVVTISNTHISPELNASTVSSEPENTNGKATILSPVVLENHSALPIKEEPGDTSSLPQISSERRMVNVSFHPQPGPKHSVPRFTCFQCGKRNLLHDSLHAHAQTHAPDKAVLNAVSVPRSFSPVVASSIIRVVSSELKGKNTATGATDTSKTVDKEKTEQETTSS